MLISKIMHLLFVFTGRKEKNRAANPEQSCGVAKRSRKLSKRDQRMKKRSRECKQEKELRMSSW